MKLTLPFPPSTNRMWRNYRGVTVLSHEARNYKQAVKIAAARIKPFDGEVQWIATAYFPDRRGDLSNRIKVIEDALNGVAWVDDKLVKHIDLTWALDRENPRIEIEVLPWNQ